MEQRRADQSRHRKRKAPASSGLFRTHYA